MSAEETISMDFSLESVEERDGGFFFTARSLSKDFECEDGLKRLARESINKHLVWRHRHPIESQHKENHVYGRVVQARLEGGYIVSTYEVYNHTPDHLAFIEVLKERSNIGDQLGISMHYRKYYNVLNEVIHYDVFEHSGTPFPACESCKTIEIGVKTMTNENDKKEKVKKEVDENIETPTLEVDTKLDDKSLDVLKKIGELETMLNDKTKKLEEYKGKIESLELETKKKSEELADKNQKTKTVEEQLLELKTEISYLKKKPMIDKLLELVKIDDNQLEWIKTQDKDYITVRYEEAILQAESKPHTKTVDESADENINKTDEEFEEKEAETKQTFEGFSKYLNREKIKKE